MHLAARRAALSLLLVFAACRTGGVPAPAPSAAAAAGSDAALAGLAAVGLPLQARDRRAGLRPPPAARRAILGFPLVVLLLLALTILLVLVPMEKPAG